MENFGFIRVAAASTSVKTANIGFNGESIRKQIEDACRAGVSLVAFPELSVSGYSCGDLFGQHLLLDRCEEEVGKIAGFTFGKDIAVIVGAPVPYKGRLYNCAVVIKDGEVKGIVPKTSLPDHEEHCESRWFTSGIDLVHGPEMTYAGFDCVISPNQIFEIERTAFAIEIGEDLYCPIPRSSYHALAGAGIIVNLSAGNETVMSDVRRKRLLEQHSAHIKCAYVYSSASTDSSQDLVFTGHASIWENGVMMDCCSEKDGMNPLAMADIDTERIDTLRRRCSTFTSTSPDGTPSSSYDIIYNRVYLGEGCATDFDKNLLRYVERHPFVPEHGLDARCSRIIGLQTSALSNRLDRIKSKAVIGISGGLDSTLALIVTVLAFDRLGWSHDGITAVTMPGFGTTSRTKNNAWDLMKALGVTCREISIVPACEQHFKDIGHDASVHDATYENTQARERTQILMDIANQTGGIVVGTGDLSELALGWATYNGDHMSMYGVNADIPKTLVRCLVRWAAENCFDGVMSEDGRSVREILLDIVETPISPELLPASSDGKIQQVTEDLVGPYELHDFFLYNFVRFGYSPEKIFFLARKAFGCQVESGPSLMSSEVGTSVYDDATIKKWLNTFVRRFFSQQFKRSCMPDGPKVGSVGLSPRGDWHMASDAWSNDFLDDLE